MWTPRYSVKQTDFLVSLNTRTVQNLLNNTDTCLPLMQDCRHHWLIQELDIIIALMVSLSHQRTARESSGMCLCSAQQHKYAFAMPTGNILEASK